MEVNDGIISLVTVGMFLNNTTNNQGNHCILVYNLNGPAIDTDNQAILTSAGSCSEIEKSRQELFTNLAEAILTFDPFKLLERKG